MNCTTSILRSSTEINDAKYYFASAAKPQRATCRPDCQYAINCGIWNHNQRGRVVKKRTKNPSEELGVEGGENGDDDRQFVVALHRGLEVLRCFQADNLVLGNLELAQRTKLPKATVSRLTYTLSALGYLEYLEHSGKYRLGVPVLALGFACLAGVGVQEAARPLMRKLADFAGTGSNVGMGTRSDLGMIYVLAIRGSGIITLQLDVGSRISLARSAMGRAYLAGLANAEREPLMERIREHVGERDWPKIEDGILRSVEEVRTMGFCLNVGEWEPEISSVAAPFQSKYGDDRLYAFNCGGPTYVLRRDFLKNDVGPRLVDMVRELNTIQEGKA
jgi:DNA-binding IclR family transcriptional regulator